MSDSYGAAMTPNSTPNRLDTDRIEAAARALLDDKVTAVRALAQARRRREDARAALTEAEREDTAAYTGALRAGWTADELKRVGLDAPGKRTPGRPRTTTGTKNTTGTQTTTQTTTGGRSEAATPSPGPGSSSADSPAG